MADLSLAMLNQVLEAALAFMILLLAMSVAAIVRVDTTVGGNTEARADGESAASAASAAGRPTAVPAPPLWAGQARGNLTASGPAPRKPGLFGPRYEARHVRGRMPRPRQPGPTGPPWGPAAPPPGLPQQGSERWI